MKNLSDIILISKLNLRFKSEKLKIEYLKDHGTKIPNRRYQ